jgi:hypothetical protein
MKTTIQKDVTACDECGAQEIYPRTCRSCGLELCFTCADKYMAHYTFAVYFQGGRDGYYCKKCDQRLTKFGRDPLHNAYRAIAALRAELKSFREDFGQREKTAEAIVESLTK